MGNNIRTEIRAEIDSSLLTISEEEIMYVIDESLKSKSPLDKIIYLVGAYEVASCGLFGHYKDELTREEKFEMTLQSYNRRYISNQ
jgi:hypothetical protein